MHMIHETSEAVDKSIDEATLSKSSTKAVERWPDEHNSSIHFSLSYPGLSLGGSRPW